MNNRAGILGCGWLGTALAISLIGKGYSVRGSSTRSSVLPALREKGIEAYRLRLTESGMEGPIDTFLDGLDQLVLNIPPGLRNDANASFVDKINVLLPYLIRAGIPHLIFVSSTSVFGTSQGRVMESVRPLPESRTGRQLLEAEDILCSRQEFHTQVFRLGGLLGPDRHPVRFLSGRDIPSGGNERVNLIRLADVIRALEVLLAHPDATGVFHGVYPEYPSKRDYYTREAAFLHIPPPVYMDAPGPPEGKQVGSGRLPALGFRFAHSIYSPASPSSHGN